MARRRRQARDGNQTASQGGSPGLRPSKLVRYPTAGNALRGLLAEALSQPRAVAGTSLVAPRVAQSSAEAFRRSSSEPSRPSLEAQRLLVGALRTRDYESYAADAARPRDLPRLEPVTLSEAADLGELIRIRRQMMKLSQQRLADLAGVGRRFVGELEAGKPTVELGKTLAACRALGLSLTLRVFDAD